MDSGPAQPIMTVSEVHDLVARIIGASNQERLVLTKSVNAATANMGSRKRRAPLTADLIRPGVAPRGTIDNIALS